MANPKDTQVTTPDQIPPYVQPVTPPSSVAPAATAAPDSDPPKRNLTREALELSLKGKYIEQGKSDKDASALAKARALEMIPDTSA